MEKTLQKHIADSGYCSRRKAEEAIREGRVKINGKKATLGTRVREGDVVSLDGENVRPAERYVYIALNKPKGYVCTKDEKKNIFSLVKRKERLFVVGRLDKDSHGLVILTNDGEFAYRLTHPSFSCEKEYIVKLSKDIDKRIKKRLKEGVNIKEKSLARMKEVERVGFRTYRVVLTEGKKRQIRRMFEVFKRTVLDLKRVRIDKYKLGDIGEKKWAFIEDKNTL